MWDQFGWNETYIWSSPIWRPTIAYCCQFWGGFGCQWTNLPHLPTHGQLWGGLTDIIDTLVTDFNWGCCFNHHSLRVCKVKRSIDSGIHNRLEPYFWMSAEVGMSVNTLYTNKKLSSNWNDYPTQKNSFRQIPTHGRHSYYSNYV